MNRVFSFNRWLLLVKQHWAENRKRYILSTLAFAGLLIMWFFFVFVVDKNAPASRQMQKITYFILLIAGGCFYASQFFKDLGSKSKAINYFLLPASILEKFLCSLLYTVVIFFIVYTAVFYVVDILMVNAANAFHPAYQNTSKAVVQNVFSNANPIGGSAYLFALFFALQAAYLLGSVFFERYSFVKTLISLFVFFLLIFLLETFLTRSLFPDGVFHRGITSYRVSNEEQEYLVELPLSIHQILTWLMLVGFPPFFWIVTYFRMKEKEV